MQIERTPVGASLRAGGLAGLVKLVAVVPFLGRYGWDRDELYFLAASRHLAFGYVDFPPATALVGRAVIAIAGPSLVALRLTGVAAGVLAGLLVALCARELGGAFRAQLAAALVFVTTPYGLGLGALFHPTMLDVPVWAGISYLALRIVGRPEPRLLPLLGLVAGVGLETKETVAVPLAVLAAALALLGPRALLRDRRTWISSAIVAVCAAPYLAWELAHGWPSWTFARSQAAVTAADTSHAAYLGQQVAFLAGATPLVVLGCVALWRRPGLRALAIVFPASAALFFAEGGRSYYALPAIVLPLAAGAVAVRGRTVVVATIVLQLAGLVLVVPLVVPVLPERAMVDRGLWRQTFYKDEIGWPELVATTARAWRAIPARQRADTALLAQNYGEAGALALLGPSHGLPPVLSGHLSFQYWRPARLAQHRLLTVGMARDDLDRLCAGWRIVARIGNADGIANEEQGRAIARCRLRRPLGELWGAQIATDDL